MPDAFSMVVVEDPGAHGISTREAAKAGVGLDSPGSQCCPPPMCPEASAPSCKTAQVVPFGSEISIQNLLEVCNLKVKFCYLKVKKERMEHERIQYFAYQEVLRQV